MKLIDYIKEKEDKAQELGLEKEAIKKILIEAIYHSYTNLIMNYNNEIDSHYFNIVEGYINRYLENCEPIQYIFGYAYFCGLKLKVNKDVLIPRPETELLVEKAIDAINTNHYKTVLDIGTGSGAIAIAIKKSTDTSVTAVDISREALEIAKTNACTYELDIDFVESDLFQNIDKSFDLIVSNPPYISYDDINNIDKIVYRNEPHLALFSPDNGLYYYKRIIDNLDKYLNRDGTLIMEIGEKEAKPIDDYLKTKENYQMEVIKDYNNLDRVVIIKRK